MALGYMWVNPRNPFHFIHTPELLPHSSAQLLVSGAIPAPCEMRVERFSLPSTFCCYQAFSMAITPVVGMQVKDIWEGRAEGAWPWEGEKDWAGSFPEIPWYNKLPTVLYSSDFTPGASLPPRLRESRLTPQGHLWGHFSVSFITYLWSELTAEPTPDPLKWSGRAVLGQLLRAQTPPGSSHKPKATSKPTYHILWPPRLSGDCGKQCCDYLSSPGHSPGPWESFEAPEDGKSWEVSRHLQARGHLCLVKLGP